MRAGGTQVTTVGVPGQPAATKRQNRKDSVESGAAGGADYKPILTGPQLPVAGLRGSHSAFQIELVRSRDGRPRSWYVDVDESALVAELAFLKIYLREVEPRLQAPDRLHALFSQDLDVGEGGGDRTANSTIPCVRDLAQPPFVCVAIRN